MRRAVRFLLLLTVLTGVAGVTAAVVLRLVQSGRSGEETGEVLFPRIPVPSWPPVPTAPARG